MSHGETFRRTSEPAMRSSGAPGRASSWKVALIVLGVVAASAALLASLAAVGLWYGWPQRFTPQDREVLVTAAELAPLVEFVLRSDREQFSKRSYFDGRTKLAYRYEHPDPAAAFRLVSEVTAAPSRAEARALYHEVALQLEASAVSQGLAFEEQSAAIWGDAVRHGVLVSGDEVAGHVLACRAGANVFVLELSGVGLHDSQWGELVAAALQSLESYQP